MRESNPPEAKVQGQHTPGPWSSDFMEDSYDSWVIRHDATLVCKMFHIADMHNLSEVRANARLIAAAPDLLESLETAISQSGFYVSGPTHPDVCEDEGEPRWVGFARAAIAKARGQ